MNLASGIFIILAFTNLGDWDTATKVSNLVPSIISFFFLLDALRRLKQVAKGALQIETWQMVWHIWSYGFIIMDGIFLVVFSKNTYEHVKWFYLSYAGILLLLFFCELPFLYIINRIVTQAIISKKRLLIDQSQEEDEQDGSEYDRMIDR